MVEGQSKELNREERAKLSERLAHKTAVANATSRELKRTGEGDYMRPLGAALFADGAMKALLVVNGLMTEEELMKEINELIEG